MKPEYPTRLFHIRYTAHGLDRDLEPFRRFYRVTGYDNDTNCYQIAVRDIAECITAFKKAFKFELKSPEGGRYVEAKAVVDLVTDLTPEIVEDMCRGIYGPTWDGPTDKEPGEEMKQVWRTYVRELVAQQPLVVRKAMAGVVR